MSDISTYLISLLTFDSSHPLLFTQIHFWVFFLVVYAIFALIASGKKFSPWKRICRNGYLFAASLLFYYKTSGLFVLLLVFSTIIGYILGIRMDHTQSQSRRKLQMSIGVAINLLVLCYFKYAYFFTDIYNSSFGTNLHVVNYFALWTNNIFGTSHFDASVILLPVGISFFTFQNISYIVDVYKRKIAHVGNILDFGFYTSFFPQLVAGPILRADQFVPQLYRPFFLGRRQFGIAVFWILNGLLKKIILSDYLAVNFVDRIFESPLLYTPFENLSALLLYSLQVYADFSGYTDIAIGVAMLMGFYLPVNFNSPYKATNPTDFWRRWHMSLSRWLRDYLYIPLGGNRTSGWASYIILLSVLAIAAFRLKSIWFAVFAAVVMVGIGILYFCFPQHRRTLGTDVNNMDTMLLGGLWHGASFNFITWGGLNGIGILVYKWWKKRTWTVRLATLAGLSIILSIVREYVPSPLFNILWFCSLVCLIAYCVIRLLAHLKVRSDNIAHGWSVILTFFFISFTRLFFRSGSNLDPAEANETAWRTASQMVNQIGSHWNLAAIPDIVSHYWNIFALFAVGMIIHWLPTRFKRRYRLWFTQMPLWMLLAVVIVVIVVIYQFITADLQPFIYFQF